MHCALVLMFPTQNYRALKRTESDTSYNPKKLFFKTALYLKMSDFDNLSKKLFKLAFINEIYLFVANSFTQEEGKG